MVRQSAGPARRASTYERVGAISLLGEWASMLQLLEPARVARTRRQAARPRGKLGQPPAPPAPAFLPPWPSWMCRHSPSTPAHCCAGRRESPSGWPASPSAARKCCALCWPRTALPAFLGFTLPEALWLAADPSDAFDGRGGGVSHGGRSTPCGPWPWTRRPASASP